MSDPTPGEFIQGTPPPAPEEEESPYNWAEMARLARTKPGQVLVAAVDVPRGAVQTVRAYTRPPFRDRDGIIRVVQRKRKNRGGDAPLYTVYFIFEETK